MKNLGVYAVQHVPSGAAYIGGSRDVTNRYTHHRYMLRRGLHPSQHLQILWNNTPEHEWVFSIVEFCFSETILRRREEWWLGRWPGAILNDRPLKGYKHSEETRQKQSRSARRVGADPAERHRRSERAILQHAEGRF